MVPSRLSRCSQVLTFLPLLCVPHASVQAALWLWQLLGTNSDAKDEAYRSKAAEVGQLSMQTPPARVMHASWACPTPMQQQQHTQNAVDMHPCACCSCCSSCTSLEPHCNFTHPTTCRHHSSGLYIPWPNHCLPATVLGPALTKLLLAPLPFIADPLQGFSDPRIPSSCECTPPGLPRGAGQSCHRAASSGCV